MVTRLRKNMTYSELQCTKSLLEKVEENRGLFIISDLSAKTGVTRSIFNTTLRLLEIAGTIKTQSLGMKGTYIEILEREMLEELVR